MLHKLVKRQIRKCTKNDQIVVEKLYSLISTAYFEFEETIKRIERTDSIFEQEVKTLHNQLLEQKKGAEDLLNGSGQIIFSFNLLAISSETKDPEFTIEAIFEPNSVLFLISFLKNSPVDNGNKLNFFTI